MKKRGSGVKKAIAKNKSGRAAIGKARGDLKKAANKLFGHEMGDYGPKRDAKKAAVKKKQTALSKAKTDKKNSMKGRTSSTKSRLKKR
jgi:hypothetical protein